MKDLATTSLKDLRKLLTEKKDALQSFRFGNAGSKSRNVKEGKANRKDIARIMTAISTMTRNEANAVASEAAAKSESKTKAA